jgi:hypothetical protein
MSLIVKIERMKYLKIIVVALCLVLWPLNLLLNFNRLHFSVQSVFKNDYQGEQLVLRNTELYPDVLMARVFQNKPRIYIDKYVGNFFALTDLNNYFFALYPEPITGNINMFKYPFLGIVFFLAGIFYIKKSKHKKLIILIFVPAILILSCLTDFEGFDFILWIPVSLIIINGINILESKNKKLFTYFSLVFILFAIPEILRSFYNR